MKQAYSVSGMVALAILSTCLARPQEPPPGGSSADTSPLITEGIVSAPIDEVWKVFSTAEGYKKLGIAKAKLDFRPGGLILSSYDPKATLGDERTIQTEILAYEPGRLVVTRIHRPPKGFPFMEAYKHVWTIVSLADLGNGRTNVRLAMVGYGEDAESQEMRAFFAKGNDWVLKKLQSQFEPGKEPTSPAHLESPLDIIDISRVVHGPRENVWRSFTTAEGWKQFFDAEAKIGKYPGEPFEVYFSPEGKARGSEGCKILSTVREEMISFQWNAPEELPVARANPTWVVVTFESLSPGLTKIRLRHLGFREQAAAHPREAKQFESARAHFVKGWNLVLNQLEERYRR